jgi:hypothetical protein
MEKHKELEKRRTLLEQQVDQAFRALQEKGLEGQAYDQAAQAIKSDFEDQMTKIDEAFRTLEAEMKKYWDEHQP